MIADGQGARVLLKLRLVIQCSVHIVSGVYCCCVVYRITWLFHYMAHRGSIFCLSIVYLVTWLYGLLIYMVVSVKGQKAGVADFFFLKK